MKLYIVAKAWAAIASRHKSRSGINKRLPALPKPAISSPENFVHISGFYFQNASLSREPAQQRPGDYHELEPVQGAALQAALASPRPSRMSPQIMKDLPSLGGSSANLNALSSPTQPHCIERTDGPSDNNGEGFGGRNIEGSISSCTSETAVASSAESGPGFASVVSSVGRWEEADLIDLYSPLSPVPESDSGESRSATPSLSASPTTTAPQVNTETILGDPNSGDGLIVENLSTTVPPIMASLTAEDRDALTSYLAEADDDRNHVEFLATLSQPRADDPVPRLAINEEGRAARPPFTSGTLEAPLRLRSSSAITSAGMLLFAFGAGDEAQSQSVEEALAAFEAFLGQNLAADQLDLVLAPGAPLPADFLARAIGRAHVNLARFTRVTVHLQSAAAQAQAPWTWPLKSRLIDVQLNGNARGAVFPWAQLQVLRISAAVKAVETAAFLVNLPQLRVLSLSLGFVGPKKTKYKRTRLPRLEKLELQAKVDPAVFLRRVHLPALRVLGLHLDIAPQGGGDKVDYGDRLLKCSILWNALQDVQLSGPSVGPTTLFLLHRLFDNEDPAIQTRCRLSRGQ